MVTDLTARVVSRGQKQFHFVEMARGNSGHGAKIWKHVFIVCPLCAVHLILKIVFKWLFCIIFNVKQICRQKELKLASPL